MLFSVNKMGQGNVDMERCLGVILNDGSRNMLLGRFEWCLCKDIQV
jgi:hypothetical protein